MSLNRTSGLALGFGIGILIAAVLFGTSWLMKKNNANLTRTQVLQPTTTRSPIVIPVRTPASKENTGDSLVGKMAPKEEEVVADIQKSLNELYGPKR